MCISCIHTSSDRDRYRECCKQGVLIKGGIHLEEIGRLQAIAFDKTGTLTKGYPEVTFIVEAQSDFIQKVMSIETYSQHPLAQAIVKYGSKCIYNRRSR